MKKFLMAVTIAASFILVSGCGGSSGSSGSNKVTATPSLGFVRNATINFYENDGTTLLGSAELGLEGVAYWPVTGYSGPVVIEVVGDDIDAEYYDESTGTYVSFPSGSSLHAIAPKASGTFAITPLTEIAYQGAVAENLFPISKEAVNALNEEVRSVFVPFIDNILSPPTLFDDSTTTGSLADSSSGRYALFLAAMAELGSGESAPALAVLEALLDDLKDGDIDGDNGEGPIVTPYTPGSFSSDLLSEMGTFASNFGNAALQASAAGFTSDTTIDFSEIENPVVDNGGGSSGCNKACLSFFASKADSYNGVPDEEVENGDLATEFSGQVYLVVISGDGTITVSGESTDFTFSPSEITMFESSSETNVLYTDVQSGYNVILQEDGDAFFLNINEPWEQGVDIGSLDNATLDLSLGES